MNTIQVETQSTRHGQWRLTAQANSRNLLKNTIFSKEKKNFKKENGLLAPPSMVFFILLLPTISLRPPNQPAYLFCP